MQWQYLRHWREGLRRKVTHEQPSSTAAPSVTVILAARNEEEGIQTTLHALLHQQKVQLHILVVDDHSSDATAARVQELAVSRVHLLPNRGHGKRAALATGISHAPDDLILLTDADCRPAPEWAWHMTRALEAPGVHWVSGPVVIGHERDLRTRYDALESHGLMLLTGAAFFGGRPEMAQGASIGFRKRDFEAIGGYAALPDYASGDDVFLMERFGRHFPGGCRFVSEAGALVTTRAVDCWPALLQQRHRWASKTGSLSHRRSRWKMALVFGVSAWWLVAVAVLPWVRGWPVPALLALILLKLIADVLILREATAYTDQKRLMREFLPAAFIQPAVVLYAGIMSMTGGTVQWKGRKVR